MNSWDKIITHQVKCEPLTETLQVPEKKSKFLVAGLTVSQEFQRCQFLVNKLFAYYPEKYDKPDIRPMMNVEWNEYLLKVKRIHGGALWKSNSPVVVFKDGAYYGDDDALVSFVSESYLFNMDQNFECLGQEQLANYFESMTDLGRRFVTMTFICQGKIIGTILIMLYADLAPKTCEYFLSRCNQDRDGWRYSKIIRIVPNSWIQIKGVQVAPFTFPCENYTVPHDRRGIVSMCNYAKHCHNIQQFNIALDATPWMDHKYVAFGIVVQGDETLKELEKVKVAADHSLLSDFRIIDCSLFEVDKMELTDPYILKRTDEIMNLTIADVESAITAERYHRDDYSMTTDIVSFMPPLQLPKHVWEYLKNRQVKGEAEVKVKDHDEPSFSAESSVDVESFKFVARSKGFRMTL